MYASKSNGTTKKYLTRPEWTYSTNQKRGSIMCSTCVQKHCFKCEHMMGTEEKIVYLIENRKDKKSKEGLDAAYGVIKRYEYPKYVRQRNDYLKAQNRIKDARHIYGNDQNKYKKSTFTVKEKMNEELKEETLLIFTEDSKKISIESNDSQVQENDFQQQNTSRTFDTSDGEETEAALEELCDDLKSQNGRTNLLANLIKNAKESSSNESETNESETQSSNNSESDENDQLKEETDRKIRSTVLVKPANNNQKVSEEPSTRNQLTSALDGSIVKPEDNTSRAGPILVKEGSSTPKANQEVVPNKNEITKKKKEKCLCELCSLSRPSKPIFN